MYKVVWFARFLEGMDKHEARRHWREVHGPLGVNVPQIEAYVQSHAVAALDPAEATSHSGSSYASCWFADVALRRSAANAGVG